MQQGREEGVHDFMSGVGVSICFLDYWKKFSVTASVKCVIINSLDCLSVSSRNFCGA